MKSWHFTHFDDAKEVCDFLNRNGLTPEDIVFGKSGIGSSYTILYYSDKYLY